MESKGSSSNALHNHSSEGLHDANKEMSSAKEEFVNHAEIAWHQMRKEWVGNRSEKLQRPPKHSSKSNQDIPCCPTTNYEDMLLSTEPFPQPISLTEMVDFLVDFWHESGLYD